jgi:hypothetical protein
MGEGPWRFLRFVAEDGGVAMCHWLAGVSDDLPQPAGRVDLGDAAVPESPAGCSQPIVDVHSELLRSISAPSNRASLRRPWCSWALMVPGAFPSAAATWATL